MITILIEAIQWQSCQILCWNWWSVLLFTLQEIDQRGLERG